MTYATAGYAKSSVRTTDRPTEAPPTPRSHKHAHAKQITVTLLCEDHPVSLKIQDDGAGFRLSENLIDYSSSGHFGLVGMKERADAAGGKFQVTSAPGEGTTVEVIVPTNSQ